MMQKTLNKILADGNQQYIKNIFLYHDQLGLCL